MQIFSDLFYIWLFIFQVVKYFPDCFISVFPHYCDIVEDWSIFFHWLPDTVFQCTKRNSQVISMLDERFAGWIQGEFMPDSCHLAQLADFPSQQVIAGGIVLVFPEYNFPCILFHILFYNGLCFFGNGKGNQGVPLFGVFGLFSDVVYFIRPEIVC